VKLVVVDVIDGGSAMQSVTADVKTSSSSSPLMHIEGLLEALTVADKDGRIVVDRRGEHSFVLFFFRRLNVAFNGRISVSLLT